MTVADWPQMKRLILSPNDRISDSSAKSLFLANFPRLCEIRISKLIGYTGSSLLEASGVIFLAKLPTKNLKWLVIGRISQSILEEAMDEKWLYAKIDYSFLLEKN